MTNPGNHIKREWRLCQINGQWTGIVHLPSWTIFEVDKNVCRIFSRANGEVKPTTDELEDLRQMALVLFLKGNVPRHPAIRPACRQAWGLAPR